MADSMDFYEKRLSKRIPFSLSVKVRSGNRSYEGHIKNVSEYGVGCSFTSLSLISDESFQVSSYDATHLTRSLGQLSGAFSPKTIIQLSFYNSSGEQVEISCSVAWFAWDASKEEAAMGVSLIDSSPEYVQFLKDMKIG